MLSGMLLQVAFSIPVEVLVCARLVLCVCPMLNITSSLSWIVCTRDGNVWWTVEIHMMFFLACLHFPIAGAHRLSVTKLRASWQSLTLPSLSTSSNLMAGRPTSCYPTLRHSFLRIHITLPTLLLLSTRIPTFPHVIPFPFTDVPIFPLVSF